MNKYIFIIVSALLLSLDTIAQPGTGKDTADLMYNKRIKRRLSLTDPKNNVLTKIYDSTGKVYTISDVVNDIILKNKFTLLEGNDYNNLKDDSIPPTTIVSYKYDTLLSKNLPTPDNIIIAEDWKIDRNTSRMTREFVSFLLCIDKQLAYDKTIRIYKLSAAGFMSMCKPYYVLIDGNKLPVTDYFENRKFNSNIISLKTVETTSYDKSKRPKEFSEVILTR
ncbi:MAG TPA: hypothetical protein VK167_00735 [Flavipsychrobacter sp.]|nr:hypothetical protein [Flavipsychrobacter sp.]